MRRLPKAYLWLLAPPGNRNLSTANSTGDISSPSQYDLMLQHLTAYAAYFGVNLRDRILIAERTTKAKHIARHAAADLFLDSFQYGAHSTATDCLRGVSNKMVHLYFFSTQDCIIIGSAFIFLIFVELGFAGANFGG